MTHRPVARSTALALPKVKITRPRRTSSRLASKTSARSASSTLASSCLSGDVTELRQRLAGAEREVQLAIERVHLGAGGGLFRNRLDHVEAGAETILGLFDGLEGARGHEGEDRGAEAGEIGRAHV